MLLIALFYLVTYHGTAYHAGCGSDILTGACTDLVPEHSAYDTADDGACTDAAATYPAAASANDLDRVNHAVCRAGIAGTGWRI
ncbi:hypothetical protein SKTS_21150 [Sulfurimicrobium lacus]|uniref:Uncharacterized protein n=1 Tax=Sulfurimicrobium lacus TaxID=2715678 RepID=A0A6F8VET4_9PROT|nr:hypothetical protein SKTS_21150 [Sulfurimicrobium lacus]